MRVKSAFGVSGRIQKIALNGVYMRGKFKKLLALILVSALLLLTAAVGCDVSGGGGQNGGENPPDGTNSQFLAILSESEFEGNKDKFKNSGFTYDVEYVSYLNGIFKGETQLSIGSVYYCVLARLCPERGELGFYLDFKAEKAAGKISADEAIEYDSYEVVSGNGSWKLTSSDGGYDLEGNSDGVFGICVAVKFTAKSSAEITFGGGIHLAAHRAEYYVSARILNAKLADISGLTIKFGTEENCPKGEIDDSKLTDEAGFKEGEKTYMVVDFGVSPRESCAGETITAVFVISPADMLSPTLFEAESGRFSEYVKDGKTYIALSYTMPESGTRHTRIVIRFIPRLYGKLSLSVGFDGAGVSAVGEYSKTLETQIQGKYSYETPLKYEVNAKGDACTVTGVADWNAVKKTGFVVIPAYHDGLPVTEIGRDAFTGSSYITGVYIPPTVTRICRSAFEKAPLRKIELSNSVKVISMDAFKDCQIGTGSITADVYFSGTFEEWSAISFENEYSNPLCNTKYDQYSNVTIYCSLYCDGELIENSYHR